jgi:tartrate dehydrogenase/decarboxylase/D-malate dehydrogenase
MATGSAAHRIAVIPGDGIGKEVMPEGVRVLEAVGRKFGIRYDWHEYDWNCDYYQRHGRMMPEDWFETLAPHDAIFYGAVGWPAIVPDHVSLWGSLIQFRRRFDQYVNLRPCRLMPGIPSPLANRKPGDIDFVVVRENTEGEYSSVGGRMSRNAARVVFRSPCFAPRCGSDPQVRVRARRRASATKSNGISITMPYWDERFRAMAQYPACAPTSIHRHPERISCSARIASTSSSARTSSAHPVGPRAPGLRTIGIARRETSIRRAYPSLFEPVEARRRTSPANRQSDQPDLVRRADARHLGETARRRSCARSSRCSPDQPRTASGHGRARRGNVSAARSLGGATAATRHAWRAAPVGLWHDSAKSIRPHHWRRGEAPGFTIDSARSVRVNARRPRSSQEDRRERQARSSSSVARAQPRLPMISTWPVRARARRRSSARRRASARPHCGRASGDESGALLVGLLRRTTRRHLAGYASAGVPASRSNGCRGSPARSR